MTDGSNESETLLEKRTCAHSHTFLFASVANATLGSFLFGYNLGVMNPLQSNLEKLFGWHGSEATVNIQVINGLMMFGAICGAFTADYPLNKLGRRGGVIFYNIVFFVLGAGLCLIKSFPALVIGRFISGLGVGMSSVFCPIYINEVAPVNLTGPLGVAHQTMVTIGILVSYCLGLALPTPDSEEDHPGNWWRFMFALSGMIALLQVILFTTIFRFETPKFLYKKGKKDEAKHVLYRLQLKSEAASSYNSLEVEEVQNDQSSEITYSDLWSPRYRKAVTIGCILSALQQFSGINAIIVYSSSIFGASGGDHHENVLATVWVGLANFLSAAASVPLLHHFGRKPLLIMGFFFMTIFQALVGVFEALDTFAIGQKLFIIGYICFFEFSIGPILWLYNAEILPTKAVGIATLLNWLVSMLYTMTTQSMLNAISYGTFFIFTGFCVFGLFFVSTFVPETKGKTPEEIDRMINGSLGDSSTQHSNINKNVA
mmetsp:Transcript_20878/g.23618  ORF Transcript_20878/g.23618 Transcript_20878/m.23618 type:complete len:486 (-) Transcript_20878:490-1947(-)